MIDKEEVAIIILNYNNFNQTISLVNQIKHLKYPVYVVDNASENESWQVLESVFSNQDRIVLIKSEVNGGYSKGNNIGIRYAMKQISTLKYIAILNPDIELCDDATFEKLCTALNRDEKLAGITAVTILNNILEYRNTCASRLLNGRQLVMADIKGTSRIISRNYDLLMANEDGVAYVDKIQGCFFIMKKDVFEQIGLFDENVFLYFEEDIIAYKLKKMGMKLGVHIETCIRHNHEVKENEMLDIRKRKFYNKCMLESKKYYMLRIRKEHYGLWKLSSILDTITRTVKDLYLTIK